jgi:hypothetical protein
VDEQDRHESEERKGSGLLRILGILGVLLAIYALSTGPIYRFSGKDHKLGRITDVVYAPLIYLSQHSPRIERFFDWYVLQVWKARD